MRTPTSTAPPDESPSLSKTAVKKEHQRLVSQDTVDAFRALMEKRETTAPQALVERQEQTDVSESRAQNMDSDPSGATQLQLLLDNQQVSVRTSLYAAQDVGRAPMLATVNAAAIIDLIEKHVRQLLISEGGLNHRSASRVMLRLNESTLAQTELLLSRTDSGWRLHANARSADAFHAIEEFTPDLAKRFAEQSLGTIEVEPELHEVPRYREYPR